MLCSPPPPQLPPKCSNLGFGNTANTCARVFRRGLSILGVLSHACTTIILRRPQAGTVFQAELGMSRPEQRENPSLEGDFRTTRPNMVFDPARGMSCAPLFSKLCSIRSAMRLNEARQRIGECLGRAGNLKRNL